MKCSDCGKRPAGERDPDSPYCGNCDPHGARFFDERSGARKLGCTCSARWNQEHSVHCIHSYEARRRAEEMALRRPRKEVVRAQP